LNLTYHKHITINNASHHTQIHSTPVFYVETQMGENHRMLSYISKDYIHRKHQLPNSPTPTGRRIQPPIYKLQPEGSYNSLNSPATTGRRLQTPSLQAPT
jgi:hypothetical protein